MVFAHPQTLLPTTLSPEGFARAEAALQQVRIAIAERLDWQSSFAWLDWPKQTALVCDNHTWHALGEALSQVLQASGFEITLINLGSAPKPTDSTAQYIAETAHECGGLVAVGSGTINDLTQYAAHQLGKPYIICGTAPSMNGYLSANAAIIRNGHKQSLPATLPYAALFDLAILKAAPQRLLQAGLGDSICRSTAQGDWLLSHLLLDTAYDPLPFELLAPLEEAMLKGDMEALIKTLLLSGIGMTLAGGSYPASEGEHLIAHYMEMFYPETAHQTYHGEQIGVTALFMSERQQRFISSEIPPVLKPQSMNEAECIGRYGELTGREIWHAYRQKLDLIGDMAAHNRYLAQNWEDIRETISRIHLVPVVLEEALEKANAPITPEDLGWGAESWIEAASHAHIIRNRFTFLDVADKRTAGTGKTPHPERAARLWSAYSGRG